MIIKKLEEYLNNSNEDVSSLKPTKVWKIIGFLAGEIDLNNVQIKILEKRIEDLEGAVKAIEDNI